WVMTNCLDLVLIPYAYKKLETSVKVTVTMLHCNNVRVKLGVQKICIIPITSAFLIPLKPLLKRLVQK
ncbi:hypothetical protein, partial [uncultured Gammaproteobacteria bacterium]